MMNPSLAVIIPCYNNVETIEEAIESALGQAYDGFEVHVCDNGSTDGARERIGKLQHPRLKTRLHEDILPRTDNWNRAYAAGFGADYLVTLHADDRLAPGALRAIAKATRGRPALIHGRFRPVSYDGAAIPGQRFPLSYACQGDDFRELLLLRNIVAVPGVTIRTDVFRAAGGWDPAWNYLQDMELWWRCAELGSTYYTAAHLGDQRAMKHDEPFPRHAAEHLRWAIQKLLTVSSERLHAAALDGLALYTRNLRTELSSKAEPPQALKDALSEATEILSQAPSSPIDASFRQRGLRALLFLRSFGGAFTPRSAPAKTRLAKATAASDA
jgi:glycosyltransferase involved in cell wall biosynthesis